MYFEYTYWIHVLACLEHACQITSHLFSSLKHVKLRCAGTCSSRHRSSQALTRRRRSSFHAHCHRWQSSWKLSTTCYYHRDKPCLGRGADDLWACQKNTGPGGYTHRPAWYALRILLVDAATRRGPRNHIPPGVTRVPSSKLLLAMLWHVRATSEHWLLFSKNQKYSCTRTLCVSSSRIQHYLSCCHECQWLTDYV